MFDELKSEFKVQTDVLYQTKDELVSTKNVLKSTENILKVTELDRDVHQHLVEKHAKTEKVLLTQAQTLLEVAVTATTDTQKLHDKIIRKK